MKIENYLMKLVELEGSDLHMKVGSRPIIRVEGKLTPIGEETLKVDEMNEIVESFMNPKRRKDLEEEYTSDFSYSIYGVARFRVNLSMQRGSYMLVMRMIPNEIPDLDKLNYVPKVLKEIVGSKNGLILVTGSTGNGKSTTVAAMLNYLNKNTARNIVTVEDPIEFLFKDEKCIVSQKEVGSDVTSFNSALKYAMRQDPDVIFIGELRDQETMEAALKASETGHLVISTLHTINAYQTVSRILDFFPEERHKQIRYQLSENIRAIISQRLLPDVNGKRLAVDEIMRNTPTIKELILSNEGVADIPKHIAAGKDTYGTQTFDQAILEVYNRGEITYETALKYATVKKDIELSQRGINFSSISDTYNEMFEEKEKI